MTERSGSPVLVGVDTGGTFTDLVAWHDGRLHTFKLPSTPPDYGRAIVEGLRQLGVLGAQVTHGTTVATNALLERKGARCALLTTAGFRDVLAIGRQARPSLYDLDQPVPQPLVPRPWRREVGERVGPDGEVLHRLDPAEVATVLNELAADGVEALAVCLLFSFARPEHEQAVAAAGRARGLYVSASSEILPEFREYERTATTVVNAYVGPLMQRYLDALAAELHAPLRVMQSNGGCIDAGTAGREAVRTVLSGPAAGVVGAWGVGSAAGFTRLLTFDMGGTSTDVALLDGGLPLATRAEVAGLPLGVPLLDIHTVGAGGGSLARRDPGGALAVGPASAGAVPGPACYGRGGVQPTVTDANVVLGRLPADRFLGGRMALDEEAAEGAVARLAAELGLDPVACAEGIVAVADTAMERALRVISVERGLDPREFTLVSFGGAGGLHAVSLAERLGVAQVLVPPHPGALSALGLLLADVVRDGSRTVMLPLESVTADGLRAMFAELLERETAALEAQGVAAGRTECWADLRYRGQSFELLRPLVELAPEAIAEDFHQAHAQRYGYRRDDFAIDLVTLRVRVVGSTVKPPLEAGTLGSADASAARAGERQCRVEGSWCAAAVYDLERLPPGSRLEGPAVLAGEDTTVLVPAGWRGRVDGLGCLLLTR